jgi:hypothetical protein
MMGLWKSDSTGTASPLFGLLFHPLVDVLNGHFPASRREHDPQGWS